MLMTGHRILLVIALVAAAVTVVAVLLSACGEADVPAPRVAPSDTHLASLSPRPSPTASPADAADRLEAVRTVELYCRLVDRGQFARAGLLCSRPDLLTRRELASLRAFRFRSARVHAAPDARTLVLLTRVRVRAGRGCPLPDGLVTLFFTLGRVHTGVEGWLITAIATSP